MKYLCANPECNFTFTHPAKHIENTSKQIVKGKETTTFDYLPSYPAETTNITETYVCPNCNKINFTEAVEDASAVESVYIYELTSGPQTELNGLLAQGYVIVNRYAKAHHLEKPKAVKP